MKYLFFLLICIALSFSAQASPCGRYVSFCDLIQSNDYLFFDNSPIICIAESTGNTFDLSPFTPLRGVEMKLINLLYGEIQLGIGEYLNSDSTFWILSGASPGVRDAFIFKNAGEQFVLAPGYGEVFTPLPPMYEMSTGYSLNDCSQNYFKYEEVMTGTFFETWNLGDTLQIDTISKTQLPAIVRACLNGETFNRDSPTIICPENTFLGPFGCLDIDDVPPQVSTIEDAMAPPYNIQIVGDLPTNAAVTTEDDAVLFFCENDPRIVNREIVFYLYTFEPWFTPPDIIGRCSFTIETKADVGSIEFIAPPDKVIDCDDFSMIQPADEILVSGDDCIVFNQSQATFSDEIRIEGNNASIIRTWQIKDLCGNLLEPQEQIFTNNCEATYLPPNIGSFNCDD